jgi:hypothetical protein
MPAKTEAADVGLDAGDNFNAALYSAKAFGLATLLIGVGAATTVWGVKTALDMHDVCHLIPLPVLAHCTDTYAWSQTQQFAHRMRVGPLTKLPVLSARIHRSADAELQSSSPSHLRDINEIELGWNWSEAENRLAEAYDKGGLSGWAQAALRELEAEWRVEKLRREKEVQTTEKTKEEMNTGKRLEKVPRTLR